MNIPSFELPSFAAYYTPHHAINFREDQNEVVVEATDLQSNTASVINLNLFPPKPPLISFPKKQIKYLLRHSFTPIVKDKEVSFQSTAPSCNEWRMEELLKIPRSIESLLFLPNGDLATACGGSIIFGTSNGNCKMILKGHVRDIWALSLLHDGNLASGSDDNTIRIWDLKNGTCIKVLKGHMRGLKGLIPLSNETLASVSHDTTIKIWNLKSGSCEKTIVDHQGVINCITSLPEGRFATGSDDNRIIISNISGAIEQILDHGDSVDCLTPLAGNFLLSGSIGGSLKLWDLSEGICKKSIQTKQASLVSLFPLADGTVACVSLYNIKFLDLKEWVIRENIIKFPRVSSCLTLSPEGNIVSGNDQGVINMWKAPSNAPSIKPTLSPLSFANKILKTLKTEILQTQANYPQHLICPLSQAIFENPHTDECGHTFSLTEIQTWLKTNPTCPLSRDVITKKLVPSLLLKEQVEEAKKKFPIPTPGLVIGNAINENENKAQVFLSSAKKWMELNEYDEALNQYKSALLFSNKSEVYAFLPPFLETQGKVLESAYSYLCLAVLQNHENNLEESSKNIEKALSLLPKKDVFASAQTDYHLAVQRSEDALHNYVAQAEAFVKNQKVKEAIESYEKAIQCDPDNLDHYLKLADLYNPISIALANIYLSVISRFGYKDKNLAADIYEHLLKTHPKNPQVHLTYLSILNKKEYPDEVMTLYRTLAKLYKKIGDNNKHLHYLSKLIHFKKSKDYRVYCNALLVTGEPSKAAAIYTEWALSRFEKEKWKKVFNMCSTANSPKEMGIPFYECVFSASQHLDEMYEKFAADKLGKAYVAKGMPADAGRVYSLVQEKFHDICSAESLGDLFATTDLNKSLHFYYIASENTVRDGCLEDVPRLFKKANKLDPFLSHLLPHERAAFITHNFMTTLSSQLASTTQELSETKAELNRLKAKLSPSAFQ